MDIQSAMNAGIRLVFGLRRIDQVGIDNIRKSIQIPTIYEISKFVVNKAAWKRRTTFLSKDPMRPVTISRSK